MFFLQPGSGRKSKGQAEFIILAVVVIIAVVGIVVFLRPSTQPPDQGLTQEMSNIKDSVSNLVESGVRDDLVRIYDQGGKLSPSKGESVQFGGSDVQIWQRCSETNIPDIGDEIAVSALVALRKNLQKEMDFYGKTTTFDLDGMRSEVKITEGNINIKVYMTTDVEGSPMPQPYEVNIPSKLGRIIDFSTSYANDMKGSRFMETVTMTSALRSNPESADYLPILGVQTGCGNTLFKTRQELEPAMNRIAKYTVDHIVWNSPALTGVDNPFYPVMQVGGKAYPDLNVAFAYPPEWDSQFSRNFDFTPNPVQVIPLPISFFVPYCYAPISVSYSFRYPVVVMVKDDTLNRWFQFATMVGIENNEPGTCGLVTQGEGYENLCEIQAACPYKVTVSGSSGTPVEGAEVTYHICSLGKTNSLGVLEGKIPCMLAELHVYKQGYKSHGSLADSAGMGNMTVILPAIKNEIIVKLYGVRVDASGDLGSGVYSSYTASGDPKPITEWGDFLIFIDFTPAGTNIFEQQAGTIYTNFGQAASDEGAVNNLAPGLYNVTTNVISNQTQAMAGFTSSTFTLPEGSGTIYAYLPIVYYGGGPAASINETEGDKITGALSSCGIKPVSSTTQECSG